MNSKIKIGKTISYTTTDGEVFSGKGAKSRAEKQQQRINKESVLDEFDTFMRTIFGIKREHSDEDISEKESRFCDDMMNEVAIYAEDGNFKGEISSFILDLFSFIGPGKWSKIQNFLIEKGI